MYVLPGHHGTGVSTALMLAALDWARTEGYPGVWGGGNQVKVRAPSPPPPAAATSSSAAAIASTSEVSCRRSSVRSPMRTSSNTDSGCSFCTTTTGTSR
ncbi:GNAT family N-acetyltransferase [Nocardia abscessus]|uniref:GNAT family N-acetyltransferase n=1 Tax=Nocardia abscessus TaxID=120957 RepID=UPI00313C8C03